MEKQDKPAATTESFASSSSSTVDKTEHTQEAERNSDSSQAAGTTSYKTRVAEHVVERAIYSVPGTTDVDGGLLTQLPAIRYPLGSRTPGCLSRRRHRCGLAFARSPGCNGSAHCNRRGVGYLHGI